MKTLLKYRWAALVVWIVIAVVFTLFMPDLEAIINERGNVMLDESYPSQTAQKLMNNLSITEGKSGIIVFTDKQQLSTHDQENIKNGLQAVKDNRRALGINHIIDVFDTPDAASQLISEDQTTILVPFTYDKNGRDIKTIQSELEYQLKDVGVTYYITGNEFIIGDYLSQVFAGVTKSALLTIAFILVILIVLFRSVVTPLISLFTVGLAYLVSIGIVGQLVSQLGFPVSSLTQMFIILILFGVGTDYNILLFNRFKEELPKQISVEKAITVTFKTAGKTVLFSALTVFIAFLSLQFVKFGVYRSAVAVAISIAVLIAVLFTLTPALFRILSKTLFWPSHHIQGHKQSTMWAKVTAGAVRRPYLAMIVIVLLILPILTAGSYKLTFDNLKDMGNSSASSVVGFNIVAEHFGKGKIMPTTVVITSSHAMDNARDLAVIDSLTEKIRKLDGVSSVSGPTQPQGSEIAALYTDSQTEHVTNGITSANVGIKKISGGLTTMVNSLSGENLSQLDQLSSGLTRIQTGMESITASMKQVQEGIDRGSAGSAQIASGLNTIRSNLNTINTTLNNQLLPDYLNLKKGIDHWAGGYIVIEQNVSQLIQMAQGIQQITAALGDPQLQLAATNPAAYSLVMQLNGDNTALNPGLVPSFVAALTQLDQGLKTANETYTNQIAGNFDSLNNGLSQVSSGMPQMVSGLNSLETAATELAKGLAEGSNGQSQIIAHMQTMSDALKKVTEGQAALSGGLTTMGEALTQLKGGIGTSRDGLNQISQGLDRANSFLGEISSVKSFYVPSDALTSSDIQNALDAFMSKDRKTAEISVTLVDDPYSDEAEQTMDAISSLLSASLQGTSLSDANILAGGETATTKDIKKVAISDMVMTEIIVLISVFIVLVLVIKSFWIPVYVTGSILLTYYSSMALTSLLAKTFLHTSEIAWNVPFFAFLVIVTLGVDYSIFLMARFREDRGSTPYEAIIQASAHVGGVVLSAAIILAGTFATIIPAGINTLAELAIAVCLGILILSVVFLPFVIPALIAIQTRLEQKFKDH
ncbi:MMPL family transporter [Dehalobacter sp. DCM]|uniref:MMPL family transporter n=1 Tax=Dehalobacter sp. DCM TaxID=2907827 RepID=UPI003081A91D|nr:MMPL family transporter [Dehalobacter sp. DCM]